jgi:NADH:ubiquinone oxidoreductase subunit 3 (subunit A)
MDILLSPPVAFLIYLPLVFLISLLGRSMAGTNKTSSLKTSIYGSGEAAPTNLAAPGYRPFFRIALFFAVLHLGILVLGTGGLNMITGIFLVGLAFALLALMLG